ncbi:galactose oxidase [Mycena galericulata]|nr:galactose oxidase [Mycena galericulata]
MPPELHSICELAAVCRKTAGDCVPPKLVGASTTVVGSRMYLFGGRLASENEIVADLYVFDLETCHWDKISPVPDEDVARARYFHSADTWKNQLVIFGGMGYDPDCLDPDNLCVLNDIRFFDIASRRWSAPSLSPTPGIVPRARYAHLSSVTGDRLFIIGGQDIGNAWLTDICIYDFLDGNWSENRSFHRRCSSYGSMAVTSNQRVCFLDDERRTSVGRDGAGTSSQMPETEDDGQPAESLVNVPYSSPVDSENPSDIYLYSNNNFADGNHGLELISPLPTTGFKITTPTATTSGTTSSPGLRFPSGAILGTHLIISGIYFYQRYQSFAIWVLDLQTMEWSRFNPGRAVESGSWSRGCVWTDANRLILFGNRHGDLADRFLSWDHVAVIDLEAFGIYQPPPLKIDLPMQMFGLAALEEEVLADFEIVCDDGQAISCSRRLLEDRWPWFKEQMRRIKQVQDSTVHILLPKLLDSLPDDQRPDSRLTSSSLNLLEPYPISRAFIQYFYSLALLTPLQRAPAVLTRLLVLATDYDVPHLQALVKHTMHWTLSKSTAAGVYEAAQLCDCRSLQIRLGYLTLFRYAAR